MSRAVVVTHRFMRAPLAATASANLSAADEGARRGERGAAPSGIAVLCADSSSAERVAFEPARNTTQASWTLDVIEGVGDSHPLRMEGTCHG